MRLLTAAVAGSTLPMGNYRFRADLNGTQFWSSSSNTCTLPGCTGASVTTTVPLTVTVLDANNTPQLGVPVYAFDETTYTGYYGTTDANGLAVFTLPQGNYRFRADKGGAQYWSDAADDCSVPGRTSAQESRRLRSWKGSVCNSTTTEQTSRPEPPAPVSAWAR